MNAFRSEALLDVILAAASILLIILMMVRPATTDTGYYRQASVAIGCFGSAAGGPWDGSYVIYRRDTEKEATDWKIVTEQATRNNLRTRLFRAIRQDEGYTRLAILVDFHGHLCADLTATGSVNPVSGVLSQIVENEGWIFKTEILPCEDRASCEAFFNVGSNDGASE